jgi:hypothetical protein
VGSQLVPVLLVLVHAVNSFHQNQLSVPVLFGVVLGCTLIRRGRSWLGGVVLGATISVKLIPLPILGVLLVYRRWRAVAAAVMGGLAFAAVPCLLYYGPDGTVQATKEWLWRVRLLSPESQTRHFPLLEADRSQALVSVLNRWFRDRPAAQHARVTVTPADDALVTPAESDPGAAPPVLHLHSPRPEFTAQFPRRMPMLAAPQLATLSLGAVLAIHWFLVAAAVAWLIVGCLRAAAGTGAGRYGIGGAEAGHYYAGSALALLIGVLISPVVFAYYLVWAYPAWAMLLERARRGGRTVAVLVCVVAGLWLVAQVGLLFPALRQAGANLWATALLAVALSVAVAGRTKGARGVRRHG